MVVLSVLSLMSFLMSMVVEHVIVHVVAAVFHVVLDVNVVEGCVWVVVFVGSGGVAVPRSCWSYCCSCYWYCCFCCSCCSCCWYQRGLRALPVFLVVTHCPARPTIWLLGRPRAGVMHGWGKGCCCCFVVVVVLVVLIVGVTLRKGRCRPCPRPRCWRFASLDVIHIELLLAWQSESS